MKAKRSVKLGSREKSWGRSGGEKNRTKIREIRDNPWKSRPKSVKNRMKAEKSVKPDPQEKSWGSGGDRNGTKKLRSP